jgi:Tfp pilus assembly protein PilO
MEILSRYRIPLLTAVGALVVVIVVLVAWISPEGTKLSSLRAQQTQLLTQQSHLQAELATLQREKTQVASNCQALTTDLTKIPGVPTVDDFFHQVTALAVAAGDPNTPSISVTQSAAGSSGVRPVAVDLQLQGTYGQMSAFVHGLDSFPRLFTVTSFTVAGGPLAAGGAPINPGTAGYNLNLVGNIFYSTGQTNVCVNATTAAAH